MKPLITLSLIWTLSAMLATAQTKTSTPAATPTAAPAKSATSVPLASIPSAPLVLTPSESAKLNELEEDVKRESETRAQAESQYQRAYIIAQQASIKLEQQVRILERTRCGAKEALTKSGNEWKCLKIGEPEPTVSQVNPPAKQASATGR